MAALLTTTAAVAAPPEVAPPVIPAPTPRVRTLHLPPPPVSIAVPNGSYLASCQNVRTEGGELKASCEGRKGGRHETSISVAACEGVDIFNRYGRLMCVTPVRARWGGGAVPPGSYLDSCSALVEGTTLRAGCLTGEGDTSILGFEISREGIRSNRIDLTRCPDGSEIANLRGDLTCIAR